MMKLFKQSATRRWGTPDAPGALVLGQQYAYEFDSIGNRIAAAEGDTSRIATYTANALNQYTQRTVPNEKDLIGTAPTNVAVTVNEEPVFRQSAYWHHALEVDNATDAAYPQVAITAVYNPPGTNTPDMVASQTGRVFVAQTPEAFTYDDDGNLTRDGRFTYTWDAENRLISATTRADLPASVPRIRVEYTYDHQSRRIASATAVRTNGTWQATESRAFIYDGWNVVQEAINHQPSTTNYYTWGLDLSGSVQGAGGIGGLLYASLDGTTAYYCYDANGSARYVGQLVSPDGELLAHYEYSPFGETIVSAGPLAKANPFRFSTKHWANLTGLGYWGYRYYHPELGRWMSRDVIQEKGGYNLYCMVNNDPNNGIDVFGNLPGYISLRPPKTQLKCTCANAAMAAWANTTPINYLLWSRWLDNKGGTEWLNYSAFDPLGIWRKAAKDVVENKLQYAEGWAAKVPCNETRVDTDSFSMLAGAAPNYMINYWTQTTTYHIFYGKTCDMNGCCQKLWASARISNAAYDKTNFDAGKEFPAWPFLISDELINQCFGGGNNEFTIRGVENEEITKNWNCP